MSVERPIERDGLLQAELDELLIKADISGLRECFGRVEVDKMVFDEIEALRAEVEPNYESYVDDSDTYEEIVHLDPKTFEKALGKLSPFIEALPAGHGKGHLYRDIINACLILNDPELDDAEIETEIVAGIFAAAFHDIGNSVVGRYDDSRRFAAHAEVGAYITGKLLKDILPPNLLLLVQYSIAAHTDYQKDISVTRGSVTITRRPYKDETVAEEIYPSEPLLAVWFTRWADRLDVQGSNWIVRHIITKNVPTTDFDGSEFHNIWEDEQDDFRYQFYPELRTEGELVRLKGVFPPKHPETTRRVLESIDSVTKSQFDANSPYAKFDSPFHRWNLIAPIALDTNWFIQGVLAKQNLSKSETDASIKNFLSLCKIVEPAAEIERITQTLESKFALLTDRERSSWANGFNEVLEGYRRWYQRVWPILKQGPATDVGSDNTRALIEDIFRMAAQELENFDPARLEKLD